MASPIEKRDWAWLPDCLLDSILSSLNSLDDYIRFSCVCKQWHSVARDQKQRRSTIPFLLVPSRDEHNAKCWSLFSVPENKFLESKIRVSRPLVKRIFGSSRDWLASLKKRNRDGVIVNLSNPFTGRQFSLPPIKDSVNGINPRKCVYNSFALSADPSLCPDDYMVAVLFATRWVDVVAMIRPGRDQKWTHFTWWMDVNDSRYGVTWSTGNVIFDKKGKWVYAIIAHGMVVRASIVDFTIGSTKLELVGGSPYHYRWREVRNAFLVQGSSGDDVLAILELRDGTKKVCKVQDSGFVKVDDLNGDAVFLGRVSDLDVDLYGVNYCARAVATRDFKGIEANCVYFLSDSSGSAWWRNVSLLNVSRGEKRQLYASNGTRSIKPPSVWVFPTINL